MCGTRGTFFKDKRRGAVLILVLFVLTGLSVLTVEFSRDILLDHAMSTSTRSILAAKPLMESGERLATAVLTRNSEAGTPDHVREDWGLFGLGLERLSAELPARTFRAPSRTKTAAFPSTPFSTNASRSCPCRGIRRHPHPAAGRAHARARLRGRAGQRPRACQRVRGFAPSMGRADGNGPRHPEMVSYADAALPAAGTPLAGTRGNPPRALASCRTGMGTGCSGAERRNCPACWKP